MAPSNQKEKIQKAHKRQQRSRYRRIDNIGILSIGASKAHEGE
ncbi:hypothetical protein JCM19240_3031 [Vibrio maritimus]|uniref:Uncharacterized protein n=1 Tax=Vibrio maritimus TaxID=990268 RepID=A0A090U253_9VIBR|nr:hypothetical protein JCM19240_3031 [Vibrio maritimus]